MPPRTAETLTPEAVAAATAVVDSAADLGERCERWLAEPALGVDTEFVRERTFYPGLGLVQVSDGREHSLIDPLAIDDLEPLQRVLLAPGVTKVFHSCGEDLEVLFHRFGAFPRPIFDTQIAAAFAGLGFSLGYGHLVSALFGVELPKGETRSNWLRRPLSRRQRTYAALDVAYLLCAHRRLEPELERLGRRTWAAEEVAQLADECRFLPDPETVYRGLGGWNLSPRELAVLKAIAAWREREARRRDLPRNFVLPQQAVLEIARRQPRSPAALAQVRALRDADRRRHGNALLDLVGEAAELPPEELPPRRRRPLDLTPYRQEVRRLRRAVAEKAADLGLPPELLAARKTVERLVRRAVAGKPAAKILDGWRREVLGVILGETGLSENRPDP